MFGGVTSAGSLATIIIARRPAECNYKTVTFFDFVDWHKCSLSSLLMFDIDCYRLVIK